MAKKSALDELMARCLTALIWTNVNQDTWSHCSRVTSYDVRHLGQHCLKYWLDAISVPGHYLNQSWLLVNGTLIKSLTRKRTRWHCSDGFSNVFCDWKLVNFIQQLIKIHSLCCNWKKVSIGWVNGSAPKRGQDIIEPTLTKMPETIVVM